MIINIIDYIHLNEDGHVSVYIYDVWNGEYDTDTLLGYCFICNKVKIIKGSYPIKILSAMKFT